MKSAEDRAVGEKHGSILISYHLPFVEVWVISLHLKTSFFVVLIQLLSSREVRFEREAVKSEEMALLIF